MMLLKIPKITAKFVLKGNTTMLAIHVEESIKDCRGSHCSEKNVFKSNMLYDLLALGMPSFKQI